MDSFTFLALVVGVLLCFKAFSYWKMKKLHGASLIKYNEGAFVDIVEPGPNNSLMYVTRLAREVVSKKGVLAILVPSQSGGTALHHINKNGTFSAKGPYYVSWNSYNWRFTGRKHLVRVLRGKNGSGWKPDHYNQTGLILEIGVAILEYDTNKYFPLKLKEFVEQQPLQSPP